MKKELISVENGRIVKGGNVIFNGLYLQIFMGEIAGVICDDIQTQKYLNDFLRGELELESGRIYLNEERIDSHRAGKSLSRQVAFIDKRSKLIDTITMEDNIFLFSDESFFINKLKYKEYFAVLQKKLEVSLPGNQKLSELSTKNRIIVELMKAYIEGKKLVVLDDLSEYLQRKEVEEIFSLLLRLQKSDMTFLVRIGFEDEYLHQIVRVTAIKGSKTMAVLDPGKQDIQTYSRRMFFGQDAVKTGTKKNVVNLNFKRETVLKFENVSTSYLNDISFSVKRGTLLKIHCFDDLSCLQMIGLFKGEIKPASGSIRYRDSSYKVRDVTSATRQGICFIEQSAYDSMMFQNMSMAENLSIPCDEKVKNFWLRSGYSESIIKQFESRFGRKTLKLQARSQKSSVRQQIIYYKWLLYFPKIIVCINPFSDVDIYMREKTIEMIRLYLERGISVILITTNLYTVNKFAGEIIRISKGKQLDDVPSMP